MHPNRAFEWASREEMLQFAARQSFAHIFTASDEGLFVVHAPVIVTDAGSVRFHVSRRNRIAGHLEGRRVLVSATGREGYHSANWYASDDQVSTWHYEAVEVEGVARTLSSDELVDLLDQLSDEMERRHSPEQPWTRDKMSPGKFEAMTKAIVGFEVDPADIRGTRKFNQHKTGEDLTASIEGQRRAGREDIAAAIQELTARK
jgi:transcriptional regulator